MNPVQDSLAQLINFYDMPIGSAIYDAEQAVLNHYLPHIFGYFLIQVGGPGDLSWLASSPTRQHCRYADIIAPNNVNAHCYGDMAALPFDNENVDNLFLPHTLELQIDRSALLAEVNRCLIPEGSVIFFNFVPHRILYFQKSFRQLLPAMNWVNFSQIRQALAQYGFLIEKSKSFFHRPCRSSLKALARLRIIETFGQALWPWMGNLQVVIARKKRFTPTPIINPIKRKQSILINNNEVAPTVRTQQ